MTDWQRHYRIRPDKIHALCGYDNVQYILPLKASTTGEKLNPDRSTLLLGFKVSEPIVTIINDGIQEINVDNVKRVADYHWSTF